MWGISSVFYGSSLTKQIQMLLPKVLSKKKNIDEIE